MSNRDVMAATVLSQIKSSALLARIGELEHFTASLSWDDVWALYLRESEDPEAPPGLLSTTLWFSRLSGWLVSLEEGSCQSCGTVLPPTLKSGAMYCSKACSQAAHRAKTDGKKTGLGEAVAAGRTMAAFVEVEVSTAKRFSVGLRASDAERSIHIPPNWLAYKDLPVLPREGCGERCDSASICGFSRARGGCIFRNTPEVH